MNCINTAKADFLNITQLLVGEHQDQPEVGKELTLHVKFKSVLESSSIKMNILMQYLTIQN